VVLFGGLDDRGYLGDTWVYGRGWTKRTPAHRPPARVGMGMSYDALRGQVVLFGGGDGSGLLRDTWTWDGTDWTERASAHAPPARENTSMAYDAAHGQTVLFGGVRTGGALSDTWTWDGTDWTDRAPAHAPSARWNTAMANDAAHGRMVLFGGQDSAHFALGDTWTWDGGDWTQSAPAHTPKERQGPSMAFDAIRSQVVLFGGYDPLGGHHANHSFNDTWTWDGTDWTKRAPAHMPSGRAAPGMAYDGGRGVVLLFGGAAGTSWFGDTWTWDGADWAVPMRAWTKLTPSSGSPGTVVRVDGRNFGALQKVRLVFIDSTTGITQLGVEATDDLGAFTTQVTVPANATPGEQQIKASAHHSGQFRKRTFIVT
jgi:hypothetical protein